MLQGRCAYSLPSYIWILEIRYLLRGSIQPFRGNTPPPIITAHERLVPVITHLDLSPSRHSLPICTSRIQPHHRPIYPQYAADNSPQQTPSACSIMRIIPNLRNRDSEAPDTYRPIITLSSPQNIPPDDYLLSSPHILQRLLNTPAPSQPSLST